MHGGPQLQHVHSNVPCSLPHTPNGQHFTHVPRGSNSVRGRRRLIIDPVVIGQAVHEATGIDEESMNRSM
jgi:hypothetical protein